MHIAQSCIRSGDALSDTDRFLSVNHWGFFSLKHISDDTNQECKCVECRSLIFLVPTSAG